MYRKIKGVEFYIFIILARSLCLALIHILSKNIFNRVGSSHSSIQITIHMVRYYSRNCMLILQKWSHVLGSDTLLVITIVMCVSKLGLATFENDRCDLSF